MTKKVVGVFKAATDTRQVPAGTVIFDMGSHGEEMFGVSSNGAFFPMMRADQLDALS